MTNRKPTTREWYDLLCAEARRQRRPEELRASVPMVLDPRRVKVEPAPLKKQLALVPMTLPRCLCRPDTEAGKRRCNVLAREFWLTPPLVATVPHIVIRQPQLWRA